MDKRLLILQATETLLTEHGFNGLSMKTISDKAGIAAGTIYRYFENKEALIGELHKHIRIEVSKCLFENWQSAKTAQEQYNTLWRNAFNAVSENPQRLVVIDMLYFIPNPYCIETSLFNDENFAPLLNFYQQGIDSQRFKDWPIAALMALSFDSAITLAQKTIKQQITLNESMIDQVRDASWSIIQQ